MVGMANTANNKSSSAFLLFVACLGSSAAWSGDWKFASGVALSERYSDNVDLASAGLEQSELITEISPRLSVRREGARIKANGEYSIQGLFYANESNSAQANHNLNGRLNAELAKEFFYLDATARMSQELLNLANGGGLGGGVGVGNTTSVGSYSISPYIKNRFGSVASVEAKLSQDGVFIGDAAIADTSSTRYTFSAVSGSYFQPLSWGTNYSRTETSSNGGVADSGNETASANARYQLSKNFGLLANASLQKYDFTGATATVRDYSSYGLGVFYTPSRRITMDALYNYSDDGNFVSGSITLTPNVRTTLKASTTKRAYGRSNVLNLTHRTKRTNWRLSYSDDLTTSQQQYSNVAGYFYTCTDVNTSVVNTYLPANLPIVLPAGVDCKLSPQVGSSSLINQNYVAKYLFGSVSYKLRRNTWQLSLFDNQREFQGLTGGNDSSRGAQATWSLRPAPRTTLTLSGGLTNSTSSTTNQEDDIWNLGLVASHQFQPKVTGSVEVRHQKKESSQTNTNFSENSMAARLNMSF
jgi:uncharacterized protein (PEP-CTERM system associated)